MVGVGQVFVVLLVVFLLFGHLSSFKAFRELLRRLGLGGPASSSTGVGKYGSVVAKKGEDVDVNGFESFLRKLSLRVNEFVKNPPEVHEGGQANVGQPTATGYKSKPFLGGLRKKPRRLPTGPKSVSRGSPKEG